MKFLRLLVWTLLLGVLVTPVLASVLSVECPVVVQQALTATDEVCDKTGRNQACYGHARLQAQSQAGAPAFTFDQPGDIIDVTTIQSLHLSPMELSTGNWGVALLRLQANLPSNQPGDVTVLTFGDVQLQNAVKPATRLDVAVASNQYLNVRLLPTTRAGVVGSLSPRQTTVAVERLADSSWLRVEIPGSEVLGWVDASLLTVQGDVKTLNVSAPQRPYYRPMQAFYFESRSDAEAPCPEVPTSGLLIQTPEGVGEVKLLINEVNIQMGSTVFFDAQPNGLMTVTTLEGHARVEAMGVTHMAVAGTSVQVALDENMRPAAPPTLPRPYDEAALHNLPIGSLDRAIEIHPPLTPDELTDVLAEEQAALCCPAGDDDNNPATPCPGNSCGDNTQPPVDDQQDDGGQQADNCPGQSCEHNPNRNDDICPGNSCANKDKNKDKK